MADFRKWLYAFAVVALLAGLTIPASAQSTTQCIANASNPNVVRAEGYTELMGDLTLSCTGGTPTPAGQLVPQINIQIFLTQNVTSKITAVLSSSSAGGTITFLESLLIIDEPNTPQNPATPILNCGAAGAPDATVSGPGVCNIISAGPTAGNSSPATYNGTVGHPNVFQGRLGTIQNSGFPSSIVFSGVPFDPPGTATRFLRITNVRANANGAGIAQANQTSQIVMNVGATGNTALQINNPQQTVAYVQRGLVSSIQKTRLDFAQCIQEAKQLPGDSVAPNFGLGGSLEGCTNQGSACTTTASGTQTPTVRFLEGFNSSWKVKNVNYTLTNGSFSPAGGGTGGYYYNGLLAAPVDLNQNVPGVNYNTESGFVFNSGLANPAQNPPPGFGFNAAPLNLQNPGPLTSGAQGNTGISAAGIASQGTRLAIALANVPNGAGVWVPPVVYLFRQGVTYTSPIVPGFPTGVTALPASTNGLASGVMVLTNTDANGAGAYSPPTGLTGTNGATFGNQPLQQVSLTNGAALIVYEILFTDVFTIEYTDVPIIASYTPNLSQNLPQPAVTSTAATGFAPFYSTAAATQPSSSLPHPRFQFTGTAANLFMISKCSCDLLFPFVTQAPGYDTGIAIANTSMDPYGTANQFGPVQMYYYGTLANGGAAPSPQCTNVASPGTCPGTTTVPAGQVLTYTLYNGSTQWGLDNRGVGFTGYMITVASFQYCHAFAFISALGAGPTSPGLSEGYVALVLDPAGLGRGLPAGEVLGH